VLLGPFVSASSSR